MTIGIDLLWLSAVFLVAVRIGPLFVLAPVFGSSSVPVRVRVLLGLALATMLVRLLNPADVTGVTTVGMFVAAAIAELIIGMSLAFGVLTAFAAFLFGGRLLDLQIGFGLATLVDPLTRNQAPLLGTLLNLLAIVLFFAVDGHHLLVRGLAYSLQQFPLGRSVAQLNGSAVVAQFGLVFAYGLALVAPAVLVLLLLDIGMALLGRTMPQMNVFIVSMPLKVAVGLLVLALSARYMLPLIRKIFEAIPSYWSSVLALSARGAVYG